MRNSKDNQKYKLQKKYQATKHFKIHFAKSAKHTVPYKNFYRAVVQSQFFYYPHFGNGSSSKFTDE